MAVDLTVYVSFAVGELRLSDKTLPPWGRLGEARSRVSKVDSGLSGFGTHSWSSAFSAASRTRAADSGRNFPNSSMRSGSVLKSCLIPAYTSCLCFTCTGFECLRKFRRNSRNQTETSRALISWMISTSLNTSRSRSSCSQSTHPRPSCLPVRLFCFSEPVADCTSGHSRQWTP